MCDNTMQVMLTLWSVQETRHMSYTTGLIPHSFPMGWLRLVGSLKLQVSFAKEPYKRDYILQEILIILRSLLIVATPYAECRIHDSFYTRHS